MKSFEITDGPRETFIHYLIAGPRDRPLCRSSHERSVLCRSVVGIKTGSGASTSDGFEILAYCIDDRWLRAVIRWTSATLHREDLQLLLDGYGASNTNAPHFEVVRSARLVTVADQLAAVQHCHFAPVQLGLVQDPAEWHWSSHRVYLGMDTMPGFARSWVANLLAGSQGGWSFAYRCLMNEPLEGERTVTLPGLEVPILPPAEVGGDPTCLQVLRRGSRSEHIASDTETALAFESLEDKVCRTTGCNARAFKSNPSARRFRLERALLVDRMMGTDKLMSVQELGLLLHCDPSWLYRTRVQCRHLYPDLFSKTEDVDGNRVNNSFGAGPSVLEEVLAKARQRKPDDEA
jgi:hypothetical protein